MRGMSAVVAMSSTVPARTLHHTTGQGDSRCMLQCSPQQQTRSQTIHCISCPLHYCTFHHSSMSPSMPLLVRGRVAVAARALPRLNTVARRSVATSVDDPSDTRMQKNRDGQRARGAPSKASAQEMEPSLGSSKLLRSTPEEVSFNLCVLS